MNFSIDNVTAPGDPNTTILLPGSCDSACEFCFWNREEGKLKAVPDYFERVFENFSKLPDMFKTLSISGGEPTISIHFENFLILLARYRRNNQFKRVVLTTHGGHLDKFVHIVCCAVDHINISRHAIGTEENQNIFKSKNILSDDELRKLIKKINSYKTCDVTLNCVISRDVKIEFCNDFLLYAQYLGASAVSFRVVAGDPSPCEAENFFRKKFGVKVESECSVCRGMIQLVNGFETRWKGSVLEPSITSKGLYEVIMSHDACFYADWGRKHPIYFDTTTRSSALRKNGLSKATRTSDKIFFAHQEFNNKAVGCG